MMSTAGSRFMVTCSGQHPMPCCSLLWWALATTSPLCHCVSLPSPLLESCTLSEYNLTIRHGSVLAALFFANLGMGKRPRTQYPHVNCKPSSQALLKKKEDVKAKSIAPLTLSCCGTLFKLSGVDHLGSDKS